VLLDAVARIVVARIGAQYVKKISFLVRVPLVNILLAASLEGELLWRPFNLRKSELMTSFYTVRMGFC
jgi:hypothetical protein